MKTPPVSHWPPEVEEVLAQARDRWLETAKTNRPSLDNTISLVGFFQEHELGILRSNGLWPLPAVAKRRIRDGVKPKKAGKGKNRTSSADFVREVLAAEFDDLHREAHKQESP